MRHYLVYVDDSGNEEHGRDAIINNPLPSDPALATVAVARAQVELADLALRTAVKAAASAQQTPADIARSARLPVQDIRDWVEGERDLHQLASVPCLQESNTAQTRRGLIFDRCVDQVAALPGVAVLTAYDASTSGEAKSDLYGRLLAAVNTWLVADDASGTIVVDGTPSARTLYYRTAHRGLDLQQRRILEDEVIRDSSESHFIQIADVCAYCAYLHLKGKPGRYLRLGPVLKTRTGDAATTVDAGFF